MRARGFTLIELLVTVAIIALLLSLIAPALRGARESARGAECMSNLRSLAQAMLLYADDHAERLPPGAAEFTRNLHRWHGVRAQRGEAFTPEGGALTPYLAGGGVSGHVRACPSFAGTLALLERAGGGFESGAGGYGYNNTFLGQTREPAGKGSALMTDRVGARLASVRAPSRTIAFADAAFAGGSPGSATSGLIEYSFIEPRFWPDMPGELRADPSIHFRHGPPSRPYANAAWADGHVSSHARTFTWASGIYPADSDELNLGWFGDDDSNAHFWP